MSPVSRIKDLPYPEDLQGVPEVKEYLKKLHAALQEEQSERIEDFDILKLANVGWEDVRAYGAKGDGSTDDTVAIQAALDSNNAFIPKTSSYYRVTGTLNVTNSIYSNGALIKDDAGSASFSILTLASASDVVIEGVWLEVPSQTFGVAALTNRAIVASLCDSIKIKNVRATNGGIALYTSTDMSVLNCDVFNSGYIGVSFRACTDFKVMGCYVESTVYAYKTDAQDNVGCYHGIIKGNIAIDTQQEAIQIENSQFINVSHNLARLCNGGIRLYGSGGSNPDCNFNLVEGNLFDRCYKTTTDIEQEFIWASCWFVELRYDADYNLFRNNFFYNVANDSTLVSDFSANVTTNASFADTFTSPATSTLTEEVYNHASGSALKVAESTKTYPATWIAYINFAAGKDLSSDNYLTVDYWSSFGTAARDNATVKLYDAVDRGGSVICTIEWWPYYTEDLSRYLIRIPDAVDVTAVKCIEFSLTAEIIDPATTSYFVLSELRHGREGQIGVHYVGSHYSGVRFEGNRFHNVKYQYPEHKETWDGGIIDHFHDEPIKRYIAKGITVDTTFTNVLLAGYKITSIIIEETAGNAITDGLNIGTAEWTQNIVTTEAIAGNALVNCTLALDIVSLTSNTSLSFSDETAWNSASLNIYITMELIKRNR